MDANFIESLSMARLRSITSEGVKADAGALCTGRNEKSPQNAGAEKKASGLRALVLPSPTTMLR